MLFQRCSNTALMLALMLLQCKGGGWLADCGLPWLGEVLGGENVGQCAPRSPAF